MSDSVHRLILYLIISFVTLFLDFLGSQLVGKMTASHVGQLVSICGESENPGVSFAAGSVISKLDLNGKFYEMSLDISLLCYFLLIYSIHS